MRSGGGGWQCFHVVEHGGEQGETWKMNYLSFCLKGIIHIVIMRIYVQRHTVLHMYAFIISFNLELLLPLFPPLSGADEVHISTQLKLRSWATVSSDNGNNRFLQSVYNLQFSHRTHTRARTQSHYRSRQHKRSNHVR